MIVPGLIYAMINVGGDGAGGWGIPLATDIAFAVAVLAMVGKGLPSGLKVFLLSLAIADDIGAVIVIALFYSSSISFTWLGIAAGHIAVVMIMKRLDIWFVPAYVAVGVGLWVAMFESGVHATLAGVILGLMAPAVARRPDPTKVDVEVRLRSGGDIAPAVAEEGHFENGRWVKERVAIVEDGGDALKLTFPTGNLRYRQIRLKITNPKSSS